jgi:hypothetical protein
MGASPSIGAARQRSLRGRLSRKIFREITMKHSFRLAALAAAFVSLSASAQFSNVVVDDGAAATTYGSTNATPGVTSGTPQVQTAVLGAGGLSVVTTTAAFTRADHLQINGDVTSMSLGASGGSVSYTNNATNTISHFQALPSGTFVGVSDGTTFMATTGLFSDGTTGQNTFLGLTNAAGIANVGGMTNAGGFNNGGSGITNAGAISGVTSLIASGLVSAGSLRVSGATATNGITNNGNLSTTTLGTTGNATIGGNLSVAGVTSTSGINNNNNVISGVAAGVASTDAANVSQLKQISDAQATVNVNQATTNASQSTFNTNQANINAVQAQTNALQSGTNARVQQQLVDNRKVASSGVASAVAAASIPALERDKKVGVGLGVGNYDGSSAFALGVAARVSESLQLKFTVGSGNGGRVSAGAGGMFSW